MDVKTVLRELESLGTERTKKVYMQQGAHEPLFGAATGAMKQIVKRTKRNQALADELYDTGNYDAMYLAGMIADPKAIGTVDVFKGKTKCNLPVAAAEIQKAVDKGRLGFKRKSVRC